MKEYFCTSGYGRREQTQALQYFVGLDPKEMGLGGDFQGAVTAPLGHQDVYLLYKRFHGYNNWLEFLRSWALPVV